MFCLNLILQFFSRKIFLDYLGTEILGLNTTATNLLQFLNLAELGIGSAIGFSLYKPLSERDHASINEILALQGWLYKRIAIFIIIGAAILMFFFPLIFKKTPLPLWYAYASFSVLLFSALLGYFVTYRQVLLTADQKDYKLQYAYRLVMIAKVIFQMIAVRYLSNGYVWWLVLEAIFAIISCFTINYTLRHTYPFLQKLKSDFTVLKGKYAVIITKIKQLFFHKIGYFVLTQTSPLIIYAYTTLTTVALYGNYLLVINGFTYLLNAVFSSVGAGIGNLIATSDKKKAMKVFRELFSLRFVVVFSVCIVIYIVTTTFIRIWIGSEYILPTSTLLLMIGTFYIMATRLTVDNFVNGYGLFGDIWAPIAEAILNIGGSIILGKIFGLNGVIAGVLISLIIMMLIWKPYYLFSRKMSGYYKIYIIDYIKHLFCGALTMAICLYVVNITCRPEICHNLLQIGIYSVLLFFLSCILLSAFLLLVPSGLRFFVARILNK